jgi:hypothetical protein
MLRGIWTRQGVRQFAISGFVLSHLIAITCWSVPLSSPLIIAVRTLVRPYMLWSGLFQSWDTFAPAPKSVNAYVKGVVITRDLHVRVWIFPRMEQLGFLERYYKERYRKFAENLPEEKNSALWPDVARHLARFYNNPTDPPTQVLLVQYRSDIVPGAEGARSLDPKIFFEYHVQPRDLK